MKRVLMLLCALLLCAAALSGCAKDAAPKDGKAANGEVILSDKTLRTGFEAQDDCRVFYEIFVGSFSDSDGNGVGDLRGIINRFDYLNDGDPDSGLSLGVEGIWLTPIFQSPSYHKYDVTDYYTIDPTFGTQEDLEDLIALCHERNVRLILDLPINHTGSKNEWFSRFRSAHIKKDVSDPYYDFYSFHARGESGSGSYAQLPGTQDYYECNFSGDMPELNFDSAEARAAVVDVAKHYLDLGVDGFRFDAAKYIYFGDDDRSLSFWEWYLNELRKIKPDLYTVSEVWDSDGITDVYYAASNCFNFTAAQSSGIIAETAQAGDVNRYTAYVQSYLDRIEDIRPDAMIVPFVSNHDMDRAAGFLTVASGRMQMAANLYLLGPGSPFIYYGEELGMRGSRGGANTDANRRLAMVWGDGDTVRDPAGTTYARDKQIEHGAAEQIGDSASLYNYYKKLIMIRKANPEIARGEYHALSFPGTKLGGFTSTYEGSTVCVLHNPTLNEITVDLSGLALSEIRAVAGFGDATLNGSELTLASQTSVVLR
ncbi:MAG: hypothetical protein II420_05420 [Oscillospiraceae bacterium]|nr:hypothetical protein [Oscillospiraceae bacterium]